MTAEPCARRASRQRHNFCFKNKPLAHFQRPLKGGRLPVINTSNAANAALNYLNNNTTREANSLSELASGSRIVNASDDAAGLALGTQLQASVVILQQDSVNVSQGQAILATADAGLAEIGAVLSRMLALASESASGQVSDDQRRQDIDVEYQQLTQEINAIASGTQYDGQSLLNYANSTGAFSWASSSVLTGFFEAQVLRNTEAGATAPEPSATGIGSFTDTGQVALYTGGAYGLPSGQSGSFNAGPLEGLNRQPFGPTRFLTGGAGSSISVTIGAFNTVTLGLEQDQVSYQDSATTSVTVSTPGGPLVESAATYLAANPSQLLQGGVSYAVNATTSSVATQSAAMLALGSLSAALSGVSQERASLGAYQARFSFSGQDIASQSQATAAAASVLTDADVAGVKAQLSAQAVMTQAAVAALTQAAQMPQELLRLIQD